LAHDQGLKDGAFMNIQKIDLSISPLPFSNFISKARQPDGSLRFDYCRIAAFYELDLDESACLSLSQGGRMRDATLVLVDIMARLRKHGYFVKTDSLGRDVSGSYSINLFNLVNGQKIFCKGSVVRTLDGIFYLSETEMLEQTAVAVTQFCQSLRV
jgi:hypothetical protein